MPDEPAEALATARALLAELVDRFQSADRRLLDAAVNITPDRLVATATEALAALDAVGDAKCTLDRKPPADIRTRPAGPGGALVMRCDHDPSHCWAFSGQQIRCP